MIGKLLIEHHLESLSLIGSCRASSESTFVKMSNCRKSHAMAHMNILLHTEWQIQCTFSNRHKRDLFLCYSSERLSTQKQ